MEDFNTTNFKREGVSHVKPARKRPAESDVKQEMCHENETTKVLEESSAMLPGQERNDRLSPVISEDPGSSTKSAASSSNQSRRESSSTEYSHSKSVHTHIKSHTNNSHHKSHATPCHNIDKGHTTPAHVHSSHPTDKSHTTPSHTPNSFSASKSHTKPRHTPHNGHQRDKHHTSSSSSNSHTTTGHSNAGKSHTTPHHTSNKCHTSERNYSHTNQNIHPTYNSYQPKNNLGSVDKSHVTTDNKNYDMDSHHQGAKSNTASIDKTAESKGTLSVVRRY